MQLKSTNGLYDGDDDDYVEGENDKPTNDTEHRENVEVNGVDSIKTSDETNIMEIFLLVVFKLIMNRYCAFIIYSNIIMIIGVILVCLMQPKVQNLPCNHTFKIHIKDPIGTDSRPRSAIAKDLNNDTRLDIVVANTGTDNIGIFFGYGNGTFQPQIMHSIGFRSRPYSVAIGDFNNDSQFDIVTANYGTNSIGMLLGFGNGTFTSICLYSLGSSRPVSAVTADINNDMCLDIIVANYDTSDIGILLGYCNASFSIQIKYSTGYDSLPYSIAIADLNGDKRPDIIVANSGTSNVVIFFGYANGLFKLTRLYSTGVGSRPFTVAVGDSNNDKRLDIIVSNFQTSTVGTFLGYGDGNFSNMLASSIGQELRPYSMVVGDFNRDNLLDVAVANSFSNNIVLLRGLGNGTFESNEMYYPEDDSTPIFIVEGDFNGDGRSDLASINNGSNSITVFIRYLFKQFSDRIEYSTRTQNASRPVAAAIGDFNNDHILDIVVANRDASNVGIFLGYGNGTFRTQHTYPTGYNSLPQSVTVGDVNNDSRPDIIVANRFVDNVGILIGYGNGSFAPQVTFSTGTDSNPVSVILRDFNHDNYLDIAVANNRGNSVGILLGYGNGSFTEQKAFPTGDNSVTRSIAADDFNKDNKVDIAVANYGAGNIGIFLGYGNGSFLPQHIFSTGTSSGPYSIITGYLNNDTMADIAITDYFQDNIGIFIGIGNGSFEKMMSYSMGTGSTPTSITLIDLNNDDVSDIVVSNAGSNEIVVIFGVGDGTFEMLAKYSTGENSRPFSIVTGNFNRDIWLDILVTCTDKHTINIFLGLAVIYNASQISYSTGSGSHPYYIVSNDFNNDTMLDILVVNTGHDNIGIRFGNNDGTFTKEIHYELEIGANPKCLAVGDFNNDFRMDIAITNTDTDSVTVALGTGNGNLTDQIIYPMGNNSNPSFVAVGDLNSDNRTDLVVLNEGTNNVGVLLSFNYATFKNYTSSSTGVTSAPISIATGDFNNDNLLDVVVANNAGFNVGIHLGYGNGSFAEQYTYSAGYLSYPEAVTVGDLNNDSFLDIVLVLIQTHTIVTLLGYGNGSFSLQRNLSTGLNSYPEAVALADFNKDSIIDIVVANSQSDNIGIFLGYGHGNFSTQQTFSTGDSSGPTSVVTGDFNNDNRLDIAVANFWGNTVATLLGYGNGSFHECEIFTSNTLSSPYSVRLADFNKDGLLDVAVVNLGGSSISILLGCGNGTLVLQTTYSTGYDSFPISLAVSDMNNDNTLDIVVANYGSNNVGVFFGYNDGTFTEQITFATGYGSSPTSIAIGNFNADLQPDIVVANYRGNTVAVLLRESSQPFLSMKTYSTGNESHSKSMTIADFNKDYRLDIAVANYGMDNIGIHYGYGNGTFMIQNTYTTGKNSKPCFVAVGDLNNDSHLDIVVANAGTNNIGILFGYGNGTFSSIELYSSDELAYPHSLVVHDFDNDYYLDVAVGNADSTTVIIAYGNGNGTFRDSKSLLLGYGSRSYSVAAGDFNRDSWIDIAVANFGTDSINVVLQTCDST